MTEPTEPRLRKILFICTGNCVRSQMAEAITNYRGRGRVEALSGGVEPAGYVHRTALHVLGEIHVFPRKPKSKHWCEMTGQQLDAIILMSDEAREQVPLEWQNENPLSLSPAWAYWDLADPTHAPALGVKDHLLEFRRIRDEIRRRIEHIALAPAHILEDNAAFAELIVM